MASIDYGMVWATVASFFGGGAAAAWLTALWTAALYWATYTLSRSTNIQLALDGPFLQIDLTLNPPKGVLLSDYPPRYIAQDNVYLEQGRSIPDEVPRYVYIKVMNNQTRPIGVAGTIEDI